MQNQENLLTIKQVAQILTVSTRTIHRWNSSGLIINPVKVAGTVRFKESELSAWIDVGMPKRKTWAEIKKRKNKNGKRLL
jgi:excisionase family DNA binding protein